MAADAEPCHPGVAAPDPLGEPVRKHPRQRTTLAAGIAATAATVLLATGARRGGRCDHGGRRRGPGRGRLAAVGRGSGRPPGRGPARSC